MFCRTACCPGTFRINIRILKKPLTELHTQNISNCTIDVIHAYGTFIKFILEIVAIRIATKIHVKSCFKSQGGCLCCIACSAKRVNYFNGIKVAVYKSIESPLATKNVCKKTLIRRTWYAINLIVRGHDCCGTALDCLLKRKKKLRTQQTLANIYTTAIVASFRNSVSSKMLRRAINMASV